MTEEIEMSAVPSTATQAMDHAKLNRTHWKAWFLSSMGIFLDGFDLFIIAIALPLIASQFQLSHAMKGLLVAAAPVGCVLGATVFGRVTDKLGRRAILLIDLLFYVVFTALSAFAWSAAALLIFRFLLGIGIGADYPVSSTYITENMPKKLRGRMMVGGFGFQALGMLAAAGIGSIILYIHPHIIAWRWMLGIAVVPAIIILLFRLTLPESPRWLLNQGKTEKAEKIASKMTGKRLKVEALNASRKSSYLDLFHPRYLRRTILTAGTWFIMDVAFYGISFFAPIIFIALHFTHHNSIIGQAKDAINHIFFGDLFLVVGILLCIYLVEKWGRIRSLSIGFIGMAVGLFLLGISPELKGSSEYIYFLLGGFVLFNIAVNIGPNPITYLLPTEVFPTHLRATGHGFAAGCAKAGAVLGAILIPILIVSFGISIMFTILGGICLIGFLMVVILGFETRNKSLDELDKVEKEMDIAEVSLTKVQEDIKQLGSELKRMESALSTALSNLRKLKPNDFGRK